jgi:hypothetical protein
MRHKLGFGGWALSSALAVGLAGCAVGIAPDPRLQDAAGDGQDDAVHASDGTTPTDGSLPPGPDATVDGGLCVDHDGDGYGNGPACLGPDCDDTNPNVHPGALEICNGFDDNCNGQTDEGIGDVSCGLGACARTATGCVGGVPGMCTPGTPSTEVCNGIDDDCNGIVDDGIRDVTCGLGACARSASGCVDGAPGLCTPGAPTTEICNGIDDDCNGIVDDNVRRSCYTGPAGTQGVGICRAGTETCSAGSFGACIGQTTPISEICGNGLDDNCNGLVDEGCGPANDTRAGAFAVTLGTSEVIRTGTTTGATHDAPSVTCACTSGPDVWYSFSVPTAGVVYIDTAGSSFDTSLVITDGSGIPVPGQSSNGRPEAGLCNDDSGCGIQNEFTSGLQSRTWGYFSPGTYYVAVGGCSSGNFTLRFQYLPRDVGSYFYNDRLSGDSSTSTVLVGTSAAAGTCGGTASGEDVRWIISCGSTQFLSLCRNDGGNWQRRDSASSTTNYDPSLYIRSARTGAEVTCNDDGGSTAPSDCRGYIGSDTNSLDTVHWGSRINNVAVPRGLNAVFVDERTAGSGMYYQLRYTIRD